MKPMGCVEGIAADGHVIVLCTDVPGIGDPVMDGGKRRVGRVYKVFGPVDAPYADVVPEKGIDFLTGTKLYFNGGSPNGKAKRRN